MMTQVVGTPTIPPAVAWLNRLSTVAATVTAATAILVLVGWIAHQPTWIQVHPAFAPMQFNTAAGLLLCAIGLLVLCNRRRSLDVMAGVTGAITALLGALTLLQYGLDVELGIDELLMEHYIEIQTSHPGRMAPNTAICFILVGLALNIASWRGRDGPRSDLGLWGLGVLTVTLAGIPLWGYLLDVESAYGWGRLTRMAVHTAAAFVLLGSALIAIAGRRTLLREGRAPRWIPALIGVACGGASLLAWQSLSARERGHQATRVQVACESIANEIGERARVEGLALRRMATRLDEGSAIELWRTDAQRYLRDFAALEWLGVWTDASGLRDSVSRSTSPSPGTTDGASEVLRGITRSDVPVVIRLLDEGQLLAFARPGESESGYAIAAILDPSEFFALRAREAVQYAVHIGDTIVYQSPSAEAGAPGVTGRHTIDIGQLPCVVTAEPSPSELARWSTPLPTVILVAGVALAVALAGICFLLMRSREHAVALVRENDERRRAEAELIQTVTKLNRVNKDLSDFAHIVSHDLKAPLRAIGTVVGWIAEDTEGQLDEVGQKHLALLLSRTKRMNNLIEGVLSYSRASHVESTIRIIDVGHVVSEVVRSLDIQDGVSVHFDRDMPRVPYDETQLWQVLQNLISNAVRYMNGPGRIRVGCVETELGWEVSVADEGPGIPKQHLDRIFDIFQTLQPRDRVESTGVGLAVVKRIVERHGGAVSVESTVGKGCRFFFTIPRLEEQLESATSEDATTVEIRRV